MKKSLLFLSMAFIALLVVSCKGKGGFTPTATGAPYEILVVTDLGVWERPAGRALFNALDTDIPGLPQPERSFRIMYSAPNNFNSTLKLVRNIIFVDIQKDMYTQAKFSQGKDMYAYPQTILTIQAPGEEEFETFVNENKQVIIDFFTRAEMNRQIRLLEEKHSDEMAVKVKKMFDCDVWLPGELTSSKTGEDFLWVSNNGATSDLSFIIYSYPYTDKNTFTREYFMQKRDSVMKANIPGAKPEVYMATDTMTVQTRSLTIQNEYTFEARGLWRMQGDFMGGPFVSHTRVDQKNNRIITAEIFVFAPSKPKRPLIRKMEASLYTLRLPGERPSAELSLNTPGK